jgi:hypothetical protein
MVAGLRDDGPDLLLRLARDAADPSALAAEIVRAGYALRLFSEERLDLEEVFLRFTRGEVA